MTLLVTELSRYGIVMVAETALPPLPPLPVDCSSPSELQALMMRAIPSLQAGIAAWGCRCVPTSHGWIGVGQWLEDVVQKYADAADLATFAGRLAQELSAAPRLVKEPMGFHVAGYVVDQGQSLPALYQVRNSETDFQSYHLHPFRVVPVYPPELVGDEIRHSASSDVGGYGRLWAWAERALPAIDHCASPDVPLPQDSLEGHMASLTARVRYVSGLYASGNPEQFGHSCHEVLGIPPAGPIHERTIREAQNGLADRPLHHRETEQTDRALEISVELLGVF